MADEMELHRTRDLEELPEAERIATLREIEEYEAALATLSPEERAEIERLK